MRSHIASLVRMYRPCYFHCSTVWLPHMLRQRRRVLTCLGPALELSLQRSQFSTLIGLWVGGCSRTTCPSGSQIQRQSASYLRKPYLLSFLIGVFAKLCGTSRVETLSESFESWGLWSEGFLLFRLLFFT
ncbi:hypothetical protein DM02DRAFT_246588 [Periconia macrospinosa]|uniref:Uncharacterized protein n=1 Tax=Periconia macrospinosa TaxID=97972 RepID=A0A2V1DZ90_9PLEO|nr:hypothetical protein DM02DRAFT_246588 [Periconia macrospinosa]